MKSLSHVWLFATPWTVAHQALLSMRFSRQEYWSGLPFPPPGDLPDPGIEPGSPAFRQTLYRLSHQGSPDFPTNSVFAASHKFLYVIFSILFSSKYFLIPVMFCFSYMGYLDVWFLVFKWIFLVMHMLLLSNLNAFWSLNIVYTTQIVWNSFRFCLVFFI